ncbi:hypothetical protein GJ744_003635 [Endocarpon pusillum]|uniref:Choline transport protein n=1 Tax=Endocarpon pusillum TaxID=364733 RepID=A0A8H7DZA6_9EURO|nr:hypothetical protein GJ744_003635 [Endocarpon pusillum]
MDHSFNQSSKAEFGDASTTYVDAKDADYELDAVYETTVAEKHRGTITDQHDMQVLGRVQELRRNFGFMSIIGFGSTLICTWEFVLAGALTSSLHNGGTAGLFWGYIVVVFAFFLIYASLAEMAAMAPTSGGQYHWVSEFSPMSCQKYLSYLTGWVCFLGWQSALVGAAFLVGTMSQGLITLNVPSYEPQPWHGTLFVIAVGFLTVFFNTFLAKRLPFVEGIMLILHVVGIFPIMIPLWVLAPRNNSRAVFTEFTNNGGWPTDGVSFMVGLNAIVVSLLGFDSSVHMSEETKNAARTLPRSIMWSTCLNSLLGLAMVITICYTIGDIDSVLETETGYPFIQIFYNTTQSLAGASVMTVVIILTILASTIATTASASRQIWSFARDKGVPFSSTISRVTPGWNIPVNSVIISLVVVILLSLINIGSTAALNALFTLGGGSLITSYTLCIGCLVSKRLRGEPLPPRPWSLGRYGLAINIGAILCLLMLFVWSFFPAATPVEPSTMNWGCLIYGSVILFSTVYYLIIGRKVYTPPLEKVRRQF